ncbi:MAG TPA: hypothetical protein VII94_02855 [Candidatus Saccharimonadales bacterium]
MSKLPYEQIAPEAEKIMFKITQATSLDVVKELWETYTVLLEAAGWDPISFDREMIKRVDSNWEEPNKTIWN